MMRKNWLLLLGITIVFIQCKKENDGKTEAGFEEVITYMPGKLQINAIVIDPSGDKWIGTDSGLFRSDNAKWLSFTALKNVRINSLQTKENNIFIGAESGAYTLQPESGIIDSFTRNQPGVSFNSVTIFNIGFGERKWFGNPAGLSMFDGNIFLQNKYISLSLVSITRVNSMAFRHNDAFFGTNGLFLYRIKYNPETDAITGASQLLGGADNPYLNYNGELTTDTIFCVMASADSSIWFGSLKGLTRNKGETKVDNGDFEYFLRDEKVRCVYEFSMDEIWAGTEDGIFVRKQNVWEHYSVENGISGNTIFCMAKDFDGSIWIGTEKGLTVFKNGEFRSSG